MVSKSKREGLLLDLREISAASLNTHRTLYRWDQEEEHRERFTCRPVSQLLQWEPFVKALSQRIEAGTLRIFVLFHATTDVPLGRVTAFDYNPRNHSAEFGYYVPPSSRNQGLGRQMVHKFLDVMFSDRDWPLHKLYATTASGNEPSIHLLEGLGFQLDGTMRDHYWFETEIQDQHCYSLLAREWARLSVGKKDF